MDCMDNEILIYSEQFVSTLQDKFVSILHDKFVSVLRAEM